MMNKDALVVDGSCSEQRLAFAAEVIHECKGVVMLGGTLALRGAPAAIICEVIDLLPNAHRCAEELAVLVENASRDLARSKLWAHLPRRALQWRVVGDPGGTVQIWPPS